MSDFSIRPSLITNSEAELEFTFNNQNSIVHPFANDSISSLKTPPIKENEVDPLDSHQTDSKGFFEKIALSISSFWGSLFKEKEQFDGASKSLISMEDKTQKTRQHFHREVNEMYQRILEIDDDYKELLKDSSKNKEALLMKLLFVAMKNQLGLKDEQGFLIIEKIEAKRRDTLELNKSEKKIQEEMARLTTSSSLAGKIDAAFFAASAVVFLNALGFMGNNPGIKKIIEHVQGLAIFAKSGNLLLDGYKKGSQAEKEKETYLLRVKKDLAQDGIQVSYEQLNQATEEISLMWQQLRELLNKEKETSSEMLKK